jgi:hypothetical protein
MTDTMITALSWGSMAVTVGEQEYNFKDCKIWPGGAREWDWQETGTEHHPGVQPDDVAELLEADPEAVILGCGVFGRLGVCAETEALLHEHGHPYHIEKTKKAVQLFNELAGQGVRVAGIFHSTC